MVRLIGHRGEKPAVNDENKVRQRFPRTRMPPWRAGQSCQRREEISRLLCGWRAQVADRDARGTGHDSLTEFNRIERPWRITCSTRSVDLIEQTVLNSPAILEMEASIIPESSCNSDGQQGFPPLPEIAMSVHDNKIACRPHVATPAVYLVGYFGGIS